MKNLEESQWQEIDAKIFVGEKIQAIKLHRGTTGSELKEAKDEVEAREKELRDSSPERFTAVAKSGCMSVIVIVISTLAAIKLLG